MRVCVLYVCVLCVCAHVYVCVYCMFVCVHVCVCVCVYATVRMRVCSAMYKHTHNTIHTYFCDTKPCLSNPRAVTTREQNNSKSTTHDKTYINFQQH